MKQASTVPDRPRGRRPRGTKGDGELLEEVRMAQQDYEVADRSRREWMVRALNAGCSYREIAEAAGLSGGTVARFIQSERKGSGAMR